MKAVSAWLALGALTLGGCSSLVQVPRSDFAAVPERKDVRVRTQQGEEYAFDQIKVSADSLTGIGYQQRLVTRSDGETEIDEMATHVSVSLADVVNMEVKKRNWKSAARWGLGAAAASAFVVAVGSNTGNHDNAQPGGGKGTPPDLLP